MLTIAHSFEPIVYWLSDEDYMYQFQPPKTFKVPLKQPESEMPIDSSSTQILKQMSQTCADP